MDRRETIIQAAVEEFYDKGFDATSISSIAERAGIGKGTVYLYFTSKDELITACYHYCYMLDVNACNEGLDLLSNSIDKLCKRMDNILNFAISHYKESKIERIGTTYKRGIMVKQEMYDDIKAVMEEGISKGEIKEANSDLLTSAYYGLASGIYTKVLENPDIMDSSFTNIVHQLISDLLKK